MTETIFKFLGLDTSTEFCWVMPGFFAQAAFALRFIVQWIAFERAGRSYVPTAFWYLSVLRGVLLLSYANYKRDPLFILGQSTGLIVHTRNLVLIHPAAKNYDPKEPHAT